MRDPAPPPMGSACSVVNAAVGSKHHAARRPFLNPCRMVAMDIVEYEKQQGAMALLKLLALGKKEFNEGKFSDAEAFLDEMDD